MAERWFWALSEDSESWSGPFDTKELAVADAKSLCDDPAETDYVYVATGTPVDPATFIDSEWLFDYHQDMNPEECPVSDTWKEFWGVTDEDFKALDGLLQAAFREWADRLKIPVWHVIDGAPEKVRFVEAAK